MLNVAAELRIADFMKGSPKNVDELASMITDCNPESRYRFLRGLVNIGVLGEVEQRAFKLTPLRQLLRADLKGSMRDAMLVTGIKAYRDAWDNLSYSVRTGKGAFNYINGMGLFEYLQGGQRSS